MAKTAADILASVTEEDTLIDSVIALLAGVKQQLKDALANGPLTQAVIDEIFARNEAQKTKIQEAIVANTDIPPSA